MECPGRLKCLATDEVFFLFLMSDLWLVNRFCRAFFVIPTYCMPHLLHSIR